MSRVVDGITTMMDTPPPSSFDEQPDVFQSSEPVREALSDWQRFRSMAWWVQVVVWLVVPPLPLWFWTASRTPLQRSLRHAAAVVVLLGWIALVVVIGSWRSTVAGGSRVAEAPPTAGTAPSTPSSSTPRQSAPASLPPWDSALDGLLVAPEVDVPYDRDRFASWIDADGDGCDTRAEVLVAQSLTPPQVDPFGCLVLSGDWLSIYDGYTTDDPTELDIDHVVSLAEAWRSGAYAWDDERRAAFANDLDHPGALIAVTAAINRSKGDKDPAGWQPPNRGAWCEFTEAWITTKLKWELTADPAEVHALRNMRVGCDV